jgi:hypothetical protein
MSDLTTRINGLIITDPAAEDRAAAVLEAAARTASRRSGSSPHLARRAALAGAAVAIALAAGSFTGPGRDVATAAGDLVGLGGDSTEAQHIEDVEAVFHQQLRDALAKAEAGELRANVDQEAAADTLRGMLSPPSDPAAAADLQQRAIVLMEKLRAAGDVPPVGSAESVVSEGGD